MLRVGAKRLVIEKTKNTHLHIWEVGVGKKHSNNSPDDS